MKKEKLEESEELPEDVDAEDEINEAEAEEQEELVELAEKYQSTKPSVQKLSLLRSKLRDAIVEYEAHKKNLENFEYSWLDTEEMRVFFLKQIDTLNKSADRIVTHSRLMLDKMEAEK